ncbi:hypothetical protein G6F46_012234 [Rhizopus delemar]|nr:hypothetical protein G6F46_012234 [Rhizopus delemar]
MERKHLIVFVHGVMGSRIDTAYASKQICERYPEMEVVINENSLMVDGVDCCGLRLAQEIYDHIVDLHLSRSIVISHFSIFGHSMGGIIARFAIGILDRQDIFKNITLMSYTSFASPHLGAYIPHNAWYGYAINNMMKRAGSPTTDQITFSDTFRDGKPLFEILADPEYEFYTALSKFKYRRSYANTMGDFNVAYYTSALDSFDYFDDSNMEITCDPEYPSIITKFDKIKPVQHKTTAIRLLFAIAICASVPIFVTWSKIKHWRVHNEILLKYKDEQDGYYSIHIDQEKGAFLFRERQKNEKEIIQEPKFKGLFNPIPGPNLKSRMDYELKCLPVQLKILKNLKQLPWDIVLVRINSLKSHRMIMGMDNDIQEGQDVIRHFVDTFAF